ncbi:MAG: hypothetical protein ABIO40_04090 [Devosia sp.]
MTDLGDWISSVWIAALQVLQHSLAGEAWAIVLVSGVAALIAGTALAVLRREWQAWPYLAAGAISYGFYVLSELFHGKLKEPLPLLAAFLLLQVAVCIFLLWRRKTALTTGLLLTWATIVWTAVMMVGALFAFTGAVI